MARKFKIGDVVRVKKEARAWLAAAYRGFVAARWYGVITECQSAFLHCNPFAYTVKAGKRGRGEDCYFAARELDLVERPKKGAKR